MSFLLKLVPVVLLLLTTRGLVTNTGSMWTLTNCILVCIRFPFWVKVLKDTLVEEESLAAG